MMVQESCDDLRSGHVACHSRGNLLQDADLHHQVDRHRHSSHRSYLAVSYKWP